jgi:hypothetical protein
VRGRSFSQCKLLRGNIETAVLAFERNAGVFRLRSASPHSAQDDSWLRFVEAGESPALLPNCVCFL